MTNKEKALELIKEKKATLDFWTELWSSESMEMQDKVMLLDVYDVITIAKLVSKPDWYYPNKGEFPDKSCWIVTNKNIPVWYNSSLEKIKIDNGWTNIRNVEAWTYLPTYKED